MCKAWLKGLPVVLKSPVFSSKDLAAAMDREVKSLLGVSWKGQLVPIPEDLLITNDDGDTFLKLRPSHHAITRMICPDCKKKNLSLSGGTKMASLIDLLHEEIKRKKQEQDSETAGELFGEEREKPRKKKAKKTESTDHPAFVSVTLPDDGGSVVLQWPANKHADVAVMLEAGNLQKCFEYLHSDCSQCEEGTKRTYNKSGRFVKGKSGQAD